MPCDPAVPAAAPGASPPSGLLRHAQVTWPAAERWRNRVRERHEQDSIQCGAPGQAASILTQSDGGGVILPPQIIGQPVNRNAASGSVLGRAAVLWRALITVGLNRSAVDGQTVSTSGR